MTIVAIDPGIDTGWATFERRAGDAFVLVDCGLGDPREVYEGYHNLVNIVIEKPQVYRAAQSKGDPNDLITLAIRVGEYKEFFQHRADRVDLVTPAVWKGQVPKPVHHRRIDSKLTTEERMVVGMAKVSEAKKHNVWDAVGLGLFYLGRTRVGAT